MTLNEYQVLAYRTTNHELTNQGLIENGVMKLSLSMALSLSASSATGV